VNYIGDLQVFACSVTYSTTVNQMHRHSLVKFLSIKLH